MNRKLKLKAWDISTKEMVNVGALYMSREFETEVVSVHLSSGMVANRNIDRVNLLQYTGLKDKNGKEVYEGHIIKCTKGCPHEVIFLQEYAGMYFGGMPAWYLSGLNEGYAWTESEEIIGNVYENPELLEVRL